MSDETYNPISFVEMVASIKALNKISNNRSLAKIIISPHIERGKHKLVPEIAHAYGSNTLGDFQMDEETGRDILMICPDDWKEFLDTHGPLVNVTEHIHHQSFLGVPVFDFAEVEPK